MSDLISRSALIEKLEEKMFDSKLMCPVIKLTDLIELIDEHPTAYSVVLVEEMKEQIGMSGEHMDNKLREWIERLERG